MLGTVGWNTACPTMISGTLRVRHCLVEKCISLSGIVWWKFANIACQILRGATLHVGHFLVESLHVGHCLVEYCMFGVDCWSIARWTSQEGTLLAGTLHIGI